MREFKTGSQLWETIEKAARKKFRLEDDCILTMVSFGHPDRRTIGECEVGLHKLTDTEFYCRGFVTYDPYIYSNLDTERKGLQM